MNGNWLFFVLVVADQQYRVCHAAMPHGLRVSVPQAFNVVIFALKMGLQ
jgi:hypothetical protein